MMRSWSPAVSSCGGAALAATAAARTSPKAKEATERASGPGRREVEIGAEAIAQGRRGLPRRREHEQLVGAQQAFAEQSRDAGDEGRRLSCSRRADDRPGCFDRESHDGELSGVESECRASHPAR